VAQEEPIIDQEDITIKVSSRNFIDQDYINIEIETTDKDDENKLTNIAQTIVSRVKGSIYYKKTISTTKPYSRTNFHSIYSKVTDLLNKFLNQNSNLSKQTTSSVNNTKKK
ncbi:1397_t:CDS:2, partial [Dentiscutata heterogama]